MKKQLLAALVALPLIAHAQFTEGFDAGTKLPAGWSVINQGDPNGFVFGPAASESTYSLPNAAFIQYHATAHDDYLVTPKFTVTAGVTDRLSYFVKNQDPKYVEDYAVKLSTTGATAADFTTVLKATEPAPSVWTNVTIDLSAFVGQEVYIAFHATSADKFRLLFDDISVGTAPTQAPAAVTLKTPANGSTLATYNNARLTWQVANAHHSDTYEVYCDDKPNPTTKISNGKFFANVDKLKDNTTYYWKVVAKNVAGESVSEIYNFTTAKNPALPYCGPIVFTQYVDPISSVTFGGMTNTSSSSTIGQPSHEFFLDKIATVSQGSEQEIVFAGNTAGPYTSRFIVFIDWDQDGKFNNTTETYFATSTDKVTLANSTGEDGKTAKGVIKVPADAKLGETRMRIKKNDGAGPFANPCFSGNGNNVNFGQAEDYTVKVVSTLGLTEVKDAKTAIYPNPVKDVMNIGTADKVLGVSIYSAEGKLVKTTDAKSVNVADLAKGVYIVKVKTDKGETTHKVVKD